MSSSYCNIVIYWPCSCPKCAGPGPGQKKEVQVARWRHDALVTTWKSTCYCNHESASSASLTIYIYMYMYKTEFSTSFRTVAHKSTFPFSMMFDGTWWFRLQCRAQVEYSEHDGTFMHMILVYINIYNIYRYTQYVEYVLSISCSDVGPLEDACAWLGGAAPKRQRVESEGEIHVKKLRAWANEWPIPGRPVGNLDVVYDR